LVVCGCVYRDDGSFFAVKVIDSESIAPEIQQVRVSQVLEVGLEVIQFFSLV
jgi:hypothetical protein